jgi:hypothetical protein
VPVAAGGVIAEQHISVLLAQDPGEPPRRLIQIGRTNRWRPSGSSYSSGPCPLSAYPRHSTRAAPSIAVLSRCYHEHHLVAFGGQPIERPAAPQSFVIGVALNATTGSVRPEAAAVANPGMRSIV